jgi:hypothetical protein
MGVKDILVGTAFGLWEIVTNLTRIRPSRRVRHRVTIFGSAPAAMRARSTLSPCHARITVRTGLRRLIGSDLISLPSSSSW